MRALSSSTKNWSGAGADEVDPADMRPDAVRRADARDLGAELLVHQHQLGRDHALGEDAALAVDVLQEGVDRLDALDQPRAQPRPFVGEEDARDDVERDDPLGGVAVAIDGEGDAELAEGLLRGLLAALQLGLRRIGDPVRQRREFGPRRLRPALPPDLVERPA